MNISFKKRKDSRYNDKNVHDLEFLLREKFSFYKQLKIGQLKKTHLLKQIRREVARMKFYISKNFK